MIGLPPCVPHVLPPAFLLQGGLYAPIWDDLEKAKVEMAANATPLGEFARGAAAALLSKPVPLEYISGSMAGTVGGLEGWLAG